MPEVAHPRMIPDEAARREGTVVRFAGGDEVYFLTKGVLHYVSKARWLGENGFVWPDSVVELPAELKGSLRWGRPAALRWSEADWRAPPQLTPLELRELAASRLRGRGLEIGAGASPFPVPLECEVVYGDLYTFAELLAQPYPGQDTNRFVEPTVRCELDDLSSIADETLDFLVACHVIEHTRSPITAIVHAHRVLRDGGSLVLVVPDKERTFDHQRPLTTLDHLVRDHTHYDRERDRAHYDEFYSLAFPSPQHDEAYVADRFKEAFPIHYHVWNYRSFSEMIRYVQEGLGLFSSVWSHGTAIDDPAANEFYFVLTR